MTKSFPAEAATGVAPVSDLPAFITFHTLGDSPSCFPKHSGYSLSIQQTIILCKTGEGHEEVKNDIKAAMISVFGTMA